MERVPPLCFRALEDAPGKKGTSTRYPNGQRMRLEKKQVRPGLRLLDSVLRVVGWTFLDPFHICYCLMAHAADILRFGNFSKNYSLLFAYTECIAVPAIEIRDALGESHFTSLYNVSCSALHILIIHSVYPHSFIAHPLFIVISSLFQKYLNPQNEVLSCSHCSYGSRWPYICSGHSILRNSMYCGCSCFCNNLWCL